MAEIQERAQQLLDTFRGSDTDDGRTFGQIWTDRTGQDLPPELGVLGELGQSDAFNAFVQAGAAGIAAAEFTGGVVALIGAGSAAVPVVGWAVAGSILAGTLLLSGISNANALADGRRLGRRQLAATNEILRLIGYPIETARYADWGDVPQFREGDAAAAWWHLRISEVSCVMAGQFLETGLHGHYRHAFLIDVETSRDFDQAHREVNEGFPYIPYRATRPQIELATGQRARTRKYGRGALHINHDQPFFDFFRGSGFKIERRMSGFLAATESILAMVKTSDSVMQRRAMVATLLLAAQAQWADRGSRFGVGAPENLLALSALLQPSVADVGTAQVSIARENHRAGFSVNVVRSAAPWRVAYQGTPLIAPLGDPVPPRASATIQTDSITPQAVFLTGYDDLYKIVLIDFRVFRVGQRYTYSRWRETLARARKVTTRPGLFTTLASDHPGVRWIEDTAGLWAIPNVGPPGASMPRPLPFLQSQVLQWAPADLDDGGPDRAAGAGAGIVPILLLVGGVYLAVTQ